MGLTKDELPYTPHSKLSTAKDQDFTSKYPLDRDWEWSRLAFNQLIIICNCVIMKLWDFPRNHEYSPRKTPLLPTSLLWGKTGSLLSSSFPWYLLSMSNVLPPDGADRVTLRFSSAFGCVAFSPLL